MRVPILLGLLSACGGGAPEPPPGLNDGQVVQWHRIEARPCLETSTARMYTLDIAGSGKPGALKVASGPPLSSTEQRCMDDWKQRLGFAQGSPRTLAFGFMPGNKRLFD